MSITRRATLAALMTSAASHPGEAAGFRMKVAQLADDILTLNRRYWEARHFGESEQAALTKSTIEDRMERLIGFMLEAFPERFDLDAARQITSGDDFSLTVNDAKELAALEPGIVPLAVIKALVAPPHLVMITPRNVPSFHALVQRYRSAF